MPEIVAEIVGQNQPVSGPSEGMSLDFGALRTQAAAMLDKADAPETPAVEPVAAAVTPDPTEVRVKGATTGQSETPVVEAKVETPVVEAQPEAKLADLADDALVKVMVDGEEVVMPWKDAKAGVSRHSKWTKNMQQLAEDRKAVEAERAHVQTLENERTAMRQFLGNKELVAQFVKQQFGLEFVAAQQAQQNDPNTLATLGDAQTMAERQAQTFDSKLQQTVQQVEERIAQATSAIEHAQQTAKHASVIHSTLHEVFTANPVLKAIPNMEDNIRFEVMRMAPQTEAEAVEAFKSVAQGMIENLGQHFKANQKITKAAEVKAKLESKTIEPPVGAAPSVQPTSFKSADGTVDWKKVKDIAMNYNS